MIEIAVGCLAFLVATVLLTLWAAVLGRLLMWLIDKFTGESNG